MPDQYWSDVTGTMIKGGPAQPENRYLLASWLTRTYFNIAYCCLGILRPGDKPKLQQAVTTALGGEPFDWVDGT